jgi:hypothetical protein
VARSLWRALLTTTDNARVQPRRRRSRSPTAHPGECHLDGSKCIRQGEHALPNGVPLAGRSERAPAVVHWKLGHYAAMVGRGRYLIEDSTFGEDVHISAHTLDEEASRYFLIPAEPLPQGWRAVREAEGDEIWGHGNTGSNTDFGNTWTNGLRIRRRTHQAIVLKGFLNWPAQFRAFFVRVGLYAAIPKSYLWVVPDAGHLPCFDEKHRDSFLKVALEFLGNDWESRH